MTKRRLVRIHGHSVDELELLLHDACDIFDDDVKLDHEVLGGWSSINIRGHSSGVDFILKLSGSISKYDIEPYRQLKRINSFFNKLGIAAAPLAIGNLFDTTETPFIIMEYVDGVVHDAVNEITPSEIVALKECLHVLSQQEPPFVKRFKSPSDHLTRAHDSVVNHEGFSGCSEEVAELAKSFDKLYPRILSYTDSLGSWSPQIMHGDLWMPNLVFQPEKVILLDFEACAYGSRYFDLAYLLETPVAVSGSDSVSIVSSEDVEHVDSLRPLVVSYLVNWSLERLLSMEAGFIEPNLSTPQNRSAIIGYIRSKLSRLNEVLS